MRKIIFTMAISMVAGLVFAQTPVAQTPVLVQEQPSDVSVSADLDLNSAYVWRGIIISDRLVAQPSVTAAYGPFSLNVWGNLNLDDNNQNDDTQVNYTAAYALPFDTNKVEMSVGMIAYTFPGHGNRTASTEEVFVKTTFNNIILTPVASVYYDISEATGWYGNLGISQSVEISDALTGKIGGSVGYGTGNYNSCYFGNDGSAFNDYNVYVSADYKLTEKASIGARLQYTALNASLADSIDQRDDIVWGGVNLSYKFL